MIEKIKKLGWPLFTPVAYILWSIDYYLVYFGLSFLFYKFETGEYLLKAVIVVMALPILIFAINSVYETTLFTSLLVTKNKFLYVLIAGLYSLGRLRSVFLYCTVNPPIKPNTMLIGLPCYMNIFITIGQIVLIFLLGFTVLRASIRDKNILNKH